jgi:hypothetical protein
MDRQLLMESGSPIDIPFHSFWHGIGLERISKLEVGTSVYAPGPLFP